MNIQFLATLLLLAFLGGCHADSVGEGSLKVRWRLEGKTCQSEGLRWVRVNLFEEDTPVLAEEVLVPCGEGETILENIPAGTYHIFLEGLEEDKTTTYESERIRVRVKEGATPSEPDGVIALQRKLVGLDLRWTFPSSEPTCYFSQIQNVEIAITDILSKASYFLGVLGCDPSASSDNRVSLVDGWVRISELPPSMKIRVLIFGLDYDGKRSHLGETEVDLPHLGTVRITVPLEPCDKNCT